MKKIYLPLLIFVIASCQPDQERKKDEALTIETNGLKTEFRWAAQNGDVEKVDELITSGADVDTLVSGNHTPLMFAVYYGHYEIAEMLIEAGANVNAVHSTDHTVLYHAIESPQLQADMIKLLIDSGVSMNPSPLFWAVIYCSGEDSNLVGMLIDAGADVNTEDRNGFTPLIFAACRGKYQLVDLLLRSGARIDARVEVSDRTALACAVAGEHTETVRLLIEAGAAMTIEDNTGATPLMIAESKGYDEIVRLLVDAGATR